MVYFRELLRSLFADEPLMRVTIAQWKKDTAYTMQSLQEMYTCMYAVVFTTPLCFTVVDVKIMTHTFHTFAFERQNLSPVQLTLLNELIAEENYTSTRCEFVAVDRKTKFPDPSSEKNTAWCDQENLFSLFIDSELSTATTLGDFISRADALSIVMQDMIAIAETVNNRHGSYLRRALEALNAKQRAGPSVFPMHEGSLLTALRLTVTSRDAR